MILQGATLAGAPPRTWAIEQEPSYRRSRRIARGDFAASSTINGSAFPHPRQHLVGAAAFDRFFESSTWTIRSPAVGSSQCATPV